jgi:D-alanyl-D-alanine carboxypeptidase/D-alanyl-D-alanine-endopeptidase (penicillin-binding protein 4)
MRKDISLLKQPFIIFNSAFIIFFSSCSVQRQIAKSANGDVLNNKALTTAHVGISIFDPAANKYLYNYQGDKYFVPASNTKLPTCYAAMKYLGDSLPGWAINETQDTIYLKPNGDPTFLHPDFRNQSLFNLLVTTVKKISLNINFKHTFTRLGSGWAWSDYDASYMAERSIMPIYGNLVKFKLVGDSLSVIPKYFKSFYNVPQGYHGKNFRITRLKNINFFPVEISESEFKPIQIPFTGGDNANQEDILLLDTMRAIKEHYFHFYHETDLGINYRIYKTQPADSLLKPMMHRSDNFFAEQSLLMVSNERLGVMNDEKIIDTLLKTDFKDLPQKPRWADGSGLSRYNLFTPQDFVVILNKMKNEFGMERIKDILPTGGEGTISNYYKADSGYIYAKTGTLSGVVAFSGFLYTKKGKLLIFSTLVNNHQASATEVRRAIEKFLQGIRNNY